MKQNALGARYAAAKKGSGVRHTGIKRFFAVLLAVLMLTSVAAESVSADFYMGSGSGGSTGSSGNGNNPARATIQSYDIGKGTVYGYRFTIFNDSGDPNDAGSSASYGTKLGHSVNVLLGDSTKLMSGLKPYIMVNGLNSNADTFTTLDGNSHKRYRIDYLDKLTVFKGGKNTAFELIQIAAQTESSTADNTRTITFKKESEPEAENYTVRTYFAGWAYDEVAKKYSIKLEDTYTYLYTDSRVNSLAKYAKNATALGRNVDTILTAELGTWGEDLDNYRMICALCDVEWNVGNANTATKFEGNDKIFVEMIYRVNVEGNPILMTTSEIALYQKEAVDSINQNPIASMTFMDEYTDPVYGIGWANNPLSPATPDGLGSVELVLEQEYTLSAISPNATLANTVANTKTWTWPSTWTTGTTSNARKFKVTFTMSDAAKLFPAGDTDNVRLVNGSVCYKIKANSRTVKGSNISYIFEIPAGAYNLWIKGINVYHTVTVMEQKSVNVRNTGTGSYYSLSPVSSPVGSYTGTGLPDGSYEVYINGHPVRTQTGTLRKFKITYSSNLPDTADWSARYSYGTYTAVGRSVPTENWFAWIDGQTTGTWPSWLYAPVTTSTTKTYSYFFGIRCVQSGFRSDANTANTIYRNTSGSTTYVGSTTGTDSGKDPCDRTRGCRLQKGKRRDKKSEKSLTATETLLFLKFFRHSRKVIHIPRQRSAQRKAAALRKKLTFCADKSAFSLFTKR